MRVKKYQAVDMPEALRRIKEELGPDAVILSTRQVKRGKGVFGMLGRPILEVTAAADLPRPPPEPPAASRAGSTQDAASPEGGGPGHGALLSVQADLDSLREELAVVSRRPRTAVQSPTGGELKILAEKVDRLLEQTARLDRMHLSTGLRRLHRHLEALDLEPALAKRVLAFLQEKVDRGQLSEGREVRAFRELVERITRVGGSLISQEGAKPRVVALVGPTGVGKTTTVAKLAARYALEENRRVGLITVDTFRIAAVEQLKTYAKIMDVPIRVALDGRGLRAAVDDLADRDLVLVDTAGQSPRDRESLAELAELLPAEVSAEVHLVLSVTARTRDLEQILSRYTPLGATRLLLTKLDETDCLGPLLGLPLASRLPLSYLTTGQNVPDDIELATPPRVAEYLLRGLEKRK